MHTVDFLKQIRFLHLPASPTLSTSHPRQEIKADLRHSFWALQEASSSHPEPLHLHCLALQSLLDHGQLSLDHHCHFSHLHQKVDQLPLRIYRSLLKSCSQTRALAHAKHLTFCLLQHPLRPIVRSPLGEYAVLTLIRCGSLESALEVFDILPSRSSFAWNAVISGHASCGTSYDALTLSLRMREEAILPNGYTFSILLKACAMEALLQEGLRLHVEVEFCMCLADLAICEALMELYTKCDRIEIVERVFDGLQEYNAVVWTLMSSAFVEIGEPKKALHLYKQMQEQSFIADEHMIVCALEACVMDADNNTLFVTGGHSIEIPSLEIGKSIHVDVLSKCFKSPTYIENNLMIMYGKCGAIIEAENVFIGLFRRTASSWMTMLTLYAEKKEVETVLKLFWQMQIEGVKANEHSLMVLLRTCCILAENRDKDADHIHQIGMALHADARKLGHTSNVFVSNTIVSMHGRCGRLDFAINVFLQLEERTLASWNSMLSAFTEHGEPVKTLQLYAHMQRQFVTGDQRSFVAVLKACSLLADAVKASKEGDFSTKRTAYLIGCALHDDVRKRGFDSNIFVCNCLLSMYGSCGCLSRAQAVFNGLSQPSLVSWNALLSAYASSGRLLVLEYIFIHFPQPNVVSWNILMATYVEVGDAGLALDIYRHNCFKAFMPTLVTFRVALQACCVLVRDQKSKAGLLKVGQVIHSKAEMMGVSLDAAVGSSLVSMYSCCGSIEEAENVFGILPQHEMLSNAMLSAYAELEEHNLVLQLHRGMRDKGGIFYDEALVNVLHACTDTGSFELCLDTHFAALSAGYDLPADILADAYGNCASMDDALSIFEMLPNPRLESWNRTIFLYSHHCDHFECFRFLDEMKMTDVRPDVVSFLSCLYLCAHTGLIDLIGLYFECMIRDYVLIPQVQHYGLILDSLGRAGDFKRVESLLLKLPLEPDIRVWTCLLAACCKHSQMQFAEIVFNNAVHMELNEESSYVLISNVYSIGKELDVALKREPFISNL